MNTAAIKSMKVMCSSMGIPQAEPIFKEYFIIKDGLGLLFKVSTGFSRAILRDIFAVFGCVIQFVYPLGFESLASCNMII